MEAVTQQPQGRTDAPTCETLGRSLDGRKEHKEMVGFVQWVAREFFRRAAEAPTLFCETVLWTRFHHDAQAIMVHPPPSFSLSHSCARPSSGLAITITPRLS